MPQVSIIILTKNRAGLLQKALLSVLAQNFGDYEVVLVDDGSTDETPRIIEKYKNGIIERFQVIRHEQSKGITISRQEALLASRGEFVTFLDDDDEWIDENKLKKQVEYLNAHRDCVLVGGGIEISNDKFQISNKIQNQNSQIQKFRPETDADIRKTMLLKNPFFTSTVMVKREAALKAGGFVKDQDDLAEDYDLWLRVGKLGSMHNFQQAFTQYRLPGYNKEKFKAFLKKQLRLIKRHKNDYPYYWLASAVLRLRILLKLF